MPLTPQDVRDKLFTSTRFAKGYDEDEVDAFLDQVEAELTRLTGENEDLKQQLAAAQAELARRPGTGSDAGGVSPARDAGVETTAAERSSAPAAGGYSPAAGEMEEMLRRTLLLAQRTADEAVAEARAEAARIVADAQGRAAASERETNRRAAMQSAALEGQRQRLEAHVEALTAFEHEYRTRLRAYLEMQLRDLENAAVAPQRSLPTPPPALAGDETPPPDVTAVPSAELTSAPTGSSAFAAPSPEFPTLVAPEPEPGEIDGG